jgi:hypothetical protein
VSSYGRNTFTRGVPCLLPVRCPLYTFPASTCRSALHLRCRSSLGHRSGRVVLLETSRPCRFQPGLRRSRRAALLAPPKPSAPKDDRPRLRHRWSALLRWAATARQNSHDSKNISVSVRPVFRRLLGVTVAARGPKPSVWPDVDKASEGHFPTVDKSDSHSLSPSPVSSSNGSTASVPRP